VSCTYSQPIPPTSDPARPRNTRRSTNSPSTGSSVVADDAYSTPSPSSLEQRYDNGEYELPETKSRRLLELHLLQNYHAVASNPFAGLQKNIEDHEGIEAATTWSKVEAPKIAFQHDNLLHAIFALSATNLLLEEPDDQELIAAHQTYFSMALREQRKAVSELSADNADAIGFAAIMILIDSIATMRLRSLEPYAPPMDWLQLGKGARSVLGIAMQMGRNHGEPRIMSLVTTSPAIPLDTDVGWAAEDHLKDFIEILTYEANTRLDQLYSEEFNDAETREAYENAIGYVGSVLVAIRKQEPTMAICRRVIGFSMVIPTRFIDFVEERRPRALVVLAHFFAVANEVRPIWWMANTPEREIWGIYRSLPAEWQQLMDWPMRRVGLAKPN
jgi:hypothetical protein